MGNKDVFFMWSIAVIIVIIVFRLSWMQISKLRLKHYKQKE